MITYHLPFTIYHLLFTIYCLLFTIYYLLINVAREFERYAELSRVACLRMNEVAAVVATGLLCPEDWA